MNREDGARNFGNKAKLSDTTLIFTEEEILAIRNSKLSEEKRRGILEKVRARKAPSQSVGRPEMIARPEQQNITSDQFADYVVASIKQAKPIIPMDIKGTVVNIHSWSNVTQSFRMWGDYWAWHQLGRAFTNMGYHFNLHPSEADITIYLRGGKFINDGNAFMFNRINPDTYNILWIYSHPDAITREEIRQYDHIFCLSQKMVEFCSNYHERVCQVPLPSCSDMARVSRGKQDKRFDIVFIGNARGESINPRGRDIVYQLDPPFGVKVGVWGMKWDLPHLKWIQDRGWWQGNYFPYYKLSELYGGAKVVINDTHPDMAKWGFIPMKLWDIIKSGGIPLTDYIEDLEKYPIPVFRSWKEFNRMIAFVVKDADLRAKTKRSFRKLKIPTFQDVANIIVSETEQFIDWAKRPKRSEAYFGTGQG